MSNLRIIIYLLTSLFIFCNCYAGNLSTTESEIISKNSDPKNTLKVWALADIQPKSEEDKKVFGNAIQDINENVPGIDLAVVAGDIVQTSDEEEFDWYLSLKPSSYVKEWYEIAGNHDLKLNRGEGYKRKIREDFYYSIRKGNVLFLFLSDEGRGKPTFISDEAFQWWEKEVVNNQDKIIVTVTHAPLEGSGIPLSELRDRQIAESGRFRDVLMDHRVDIWLSGHLHLPHSLGNSIIRKEEFGGTIFVNISSIRPELMGLKESESRIITFFCGSDEVLIRARNHKREMYLKSLDTKFRLSGNYMCK